MSRLAQWLAVTVGVHIGAPIYAALSHQPVDWGDPFHASFGAAVALWLFEERSNDQG